MWYKYLCRVCRTAGTCPLGAGLAALVLAASVGAAGTWNVSNMTGFDDAMRNLSPGDTVIMQPGTYDFTTRHGYYITTSGVTIRGATGNRDDVTIWAGGINNPSGVYEPLQLAAPDITLRDLTISGAYHHAIHFQNGADRARVRNVKTLNIGEHHMKGVRFVDDGVIEYCLLEQTEVRQNGLSGRPDNYIGGIDLLGARGWSIRDNVARDVKAADAGYGDAGIFLWQDIEDCVVERNIVVGCNKGIAIGNPSYTGDFHADDTVVRNNFIVRGDDIGLELCYTRNVQAYHNTVYGDDGNYFRAVHIYDNSSVRTVDLDLANNLIRGKIFRNAGGTWTERGNIEGTTAATSWFVGPAAGDLHLTASAAAAVDGGVAGLGVGEDHDTGARDAAPDVGADEYLTPWPGDGNRDGTVDVLDLAGLANNFGLVQTAAWTHGDFNRDFAVDVLDLAVVANNFGHTDGGAAPAPAPGALAVLLAGAPLLARRRFPRRRRT